MSDQPTSETNAEDAAAETTDESSAAPVDAAAEAETGEHADREVERLVREGLLISESVVVMRVKNRIIMRVLGEVGEVDAETADAYVDEATLEVVHEMRESAARLRILIAEARHAHVDSRYRDTEFGPKDVASLQLRRRTELALAEALSAAAETEEYRASMADRARQAAMDDMFRARLNTDLPVDVNRRDPAYRYQQLQELARQLDSEVTRVERRRKRDALLDRIRFWRRRSDDATTTAE